ncbi:Hsp33 protein [Seminavis robusta]|uniref:Hsp33 protein n=1 Tax=Seminavis robusta TaxID=568900 RepID=A0A9N8EPA8_9STRA|nr:Hsp33 protein [Seminavis robusta]|eukprot:Sro1524_g279600.1 Hsp33 protein (109) ;mRNA; f:10179-10505
MSSTDSDDPWAEYRNKNNIADQVVSAISKDGGIKVTACTIRNMVKYLMIQHTMTNTPIQAIGRTMTCALLMSNAMQDEQTLQITLNCKYRVLLLSWHGMAWQRGMCSR